ncbi:hypothetical protein Cgig2_033721 [Carnegiea gigantea]|uniref:Cytochrome P450 n=1 Tax=Carnegiea gigantea TaxID=171969 RepID=A0A9Q1K7V9_9CARY|nr:hypothetical protein Cgig2_033721 [Carnegiea gigantea]
MWRRSIDKLGRSLKVLSISAYLGRPKKWVSDHLRNTEGNSIESSNSNKFLRHRFLNFFIAGRCTTSVTLSWLFYLLLKNPQVLSKLKEGLDVIMAKSKDEHEDGLDPPVPFQAKVPMEPDILPSVHQLDPSMQIIISMYVMGRMRSIWGEDCYEFKPQISMSDGGKIRYERSYKFLTFNSGPRICVEHGLHPNEGRRGHYNE